MNEHIHALAAEYLEVIDLALDTSLLDYERRELDSVRTNAHNALVAALGEDYARPFDMERYAREVVRAAAH